MHNKSRTALKGKTNCTNEILFLMGNNKVPGMKGNGPDKNGLQTLIITGHGDFHVMKAIIIYLNNNNNNKNTNDKLSVCPPPIN